MRRQKKISNIDSSALDHDDFTAVAIRRRVVGNREKKTSVGGRNFLRNFDPSINVFMDAEFVDCEEDIHSNGKDECVTFTTLDMEVSKAIKSYMSGAKIDRDSSTKIDISVADSSEIGSSKFSSAEKSKYLFEELSNGGSNLNFTCGLYLRVSHNEQAVLRGAHQTLLQCSYVVLTAIEPKDEEVTLNLILANPDYGFVLMKEYIDYISQFKGFLLVKKKLRKQSFRIIQRNL